MAENKKTRMKNYYHLDIVTESKCGAPEVIDIATYTNLRDAIKHANALLRGMNYATMRNDYYRILDSDLYVIRKYGYRYDNKAYKWKLHQKTSIL